MATNIEMLKFYLHRGFENCVELINCWDADFFANNCGIRGNCIVDASNNSVTIFNYKIASNGLDILWFEFRELFKKLNVKIEINTSAKGINIVPNN